ncbi:MAG TPA: TIGR02996 domain-containing protein [Gemmataceae bacterium]|nr:TIGR02996 domain-containing protein [Gemmataceae bacterium]
MPDDPAFIRMIAATPDDDAPRLVYADVLDERGDAASVARAEFIRVQCERARLEPDSPPWRVLWRRDADLLDWARRWRMELPAIEGIQFGGFLRGFIDHVTADAEPLSRHFRVILDAVPLRKLTLEKSNTEISRRIVAMSELTEVIELELSLQYPVRGENLLMFADRGPWPRLRRLHVPVLSERGDRRRGRLRDIQKVLYAKFGDRLTL